MDMGKIEFEQVESQAQRTEAGELIRAYLQWLNKRLASDYGMTFDADSMVESDLSDTLKFHPPSGRFYLALYDGEVAGVGCLKSLGAEVGELQRMYVLPEFRGNGVGRALANRLIEDARSMGLKELRLESLEFLKAAHALYDSLGFKRIGRYADNSMGDYQPADQLNQYYKITVFMQMDL
jgi:GNAT superfamily N-acetyltransferase